MVFSEVVLRQGRGTQVRFLLAAGGLLLVASLVLSMVSRLSSRMTGSRCPRCGKPVPQGHTYCPDHLKEAVNRYRDDQRQKGDPG